VLVRSHSFCTFFQVQLGMFSTLPQLGPPFFFSINTMIHNSSKYSRKKSFDHKCISLTIFSPQNEICVKFKHVSLVLQFCPFALLQLCKTSFRGSLPREHSCTINLIKLVRWGFVTQYLVFDYMYNPSIS
jgi:hypothetical protein